jgi:hypothetical protein
VGAVATPEALDAAIRSYRLALPTPGLIDEPAMEAARKSAHDAGLILLGEVHGVAENAALIYWLMEQLDLRGLALEWPDGLRNLVEEFLVFDRIDVTTLGLDDEMRFWCGDGRITAGHFAALKRLKASGRLQSLVLSDAPAPDGDWSGRDSGMAGAVLAERNPDVPTLVVAGGLHTRLAEHEHGIPMGARLAEQLPGLREIRVEYGSGAYFNGSLKTFAAKLPGEERYKRLFSQRGDGNFIVEVWDVGAADVPCR